MWRGGTVLTHDLAPEQCHSVYDFYKNPPVSVNICVGKTQHEVCFFFLLIPAPLENVEFKICRKLFH